MNSAYRYTDRKQAGMFLGDHLAEKYKGLTDLLIIGIPRGGVEVAFYVAMTMQAPLSLIVSKKLPYPGQPEFGFGAVAEEHTVYVADEFKRDLPATLVEKSVAEQETEIARRVELYRNSAPLSDFRGKTVFLIDDGIATGVTLVPCIRLCRAKQAAKVIIAAPVSGQQYDPHMAEADAIEVLYRPADFHAVGQAYERFGDFTDKELLKLLQKQEDNYENTRLPG
ncbi:MAG TPA: phosphoribosyltransferase family protein [Mucilaginibacter sp.]